jgi:hypothetical protein
MNFEETWFDRHQQVIVRCNFDRWRTAGEAKHCGTLLWASDAQTVSKSSHSFIPRLKPLGSRGKEKRKKGNDLNRTKRYLQEGEDSRLQTKNRKYEVSGQAPRLRVSRGFQCLGPVFLIPSTSFWKANGLR